MKVALLADQQWLRREQPTLRRLAVAFVEQKVQLVTLVPRSFAGPSEGIALPVQSLSYRASEWFWIQNFRVARMVGPLRLADPDCLHVLSPALLPAALMLARWLDVPLVSSFWSMDQVRRLKPPRQGIQLAFTAASKPICDALTELAWDGADIQLVRPGVYTGLAPLSPPPFQTRGESLNCLVLIERMDAQVGRFLASIAAAKQNLPGVMFFIYCPSRNQHDVWLKAKSLGLLSQISMVPSEWVNRELVLRADVLLQPQATGMVSTLTLQAMEAGRPVLAVADPGLDYLHDGRNVLIVEDANPSAWGDCIAELIRDQSHCIQIAESARQYVKQHHSAHEVAGRFVSIYERLTTPAPLPFAAT